MSAPAPITQRIEDAYRAFTYACSLLQLYWTSYGVHHIWMRTHQETSAMSFAEAMTAIMEEFPADEINVLKPDFDAIVAVASRITVPAATGLHANARAINALFASQAAQVVCLRAPIEALRIKLLDAFLRAKGVRDALSQEAVAFLAADTCDATRVHTVPVDLFPIVSYFHHRTNRIHAVMDRVIRHGDATVLPLLKRLVEGYSDSSFSHIPTHDAGGTGWEQIARLRSVMQQVLQDMKRRQWKLEEADVRHLCTKDYSGISTYPLAMFYTQMCVVSNVVFGMLEPVERERMVRHFLNHPTELGATANVLLGLVAPDTTTNPNELEMEVYVNMVVGNTQAHIFGGLDGAGVWRGHTRREMSIGLSDSLYDANTDVRDINKIIAEYYGMPEGLGSDWDDREHNKPTSDIKQDSKKPKQ